MNTNRKQQDKQQPGRTQKTPNRPDRPTGGYHDSDLDNNLNRDNLGKKQKKDINSAK